MPTGFARSSAGSTCCIFWIVGIALTSWVVAQHTALGVKLLPELKKVAGGHDALYNTPRYHRFRRLLGRVIASKWLVFATVIGRLFVLAVGMAIVETVFPHLQAVLRC